MKKSVVGFVFILSLFFLIMSLVFVSAFSFSDLIDKFTGKVIGDSCGDGVCNGDETPDNCPVDCYTPEVCGNGVCDFNEDSSSCPQDCQPSYCGDGTCDNDEDCSTCSNDCGDCCDSVWEWLGLNSCYHCGDNSCNGDETCSSCLQDCGSCNKCGDGVCESSIGENCDSCVVDCSCFYPSCNDNIKNQDETGVDCGGVCPACPTCSDGEQNQDETGVDCGGICPACTTCSDGIQNQDETGVDCGGICPACPTCSDGEQNQDETGIDCGGNSCPSCQTYETCSDGIQNQDETGVDCGGVCPACPTCSDGIQNQDETGVDCGGVCPACASCSPALSEVKVFLDEDYKTTTKENRKFTPDKITPFDDIVCEVQYNPGVEDPDQACSTSAIKGKLLTMSDPEADESQDSNWDTEIKNGDFEESNNEDGKYAWKITGWGNDDNPQGWTSNNDDLKKLIESKKLKCVAYLSDKPEINDSTTSLEQPYSNCVHLWGKDDVKFPIATVMGVSTNKDVKDFFVYSKKTRSAFDNIAPYNRYIDHFSFYLDINKSQDLEGVSLNPVGKLIKSGSFNDIDYLPNKVRNSNSCGSDKRVAFFHDRSSAAYSHPEVSGFITFIPLITKDSITGQVISNWRDDLTIAHEFGHNICNLYDEYDQTIRYKDLPLWQVQLIKLSDLFSSPPGKNCNSFPNWGSFGDNFSKGCETFSDAFRPSDSSLMNSIIPPFSTAKFNVVSCGYCTQIIRGGSLYSADEECMGMDTIKPTGQN